VEWNLCCYFTKTNNQHIILIGLIHLILAYYNVIRILFKRNNSFITCIDNWIKYIDSTLTKMEGCDNYFIFISNTSHKNEIIIKKRFSSDILQSDKAV